MSNSRYHPSPFFDANDERTKRAEALSKADWMTVAVIFYAWLLQKQVSPDLIEQALTKAEVVAKRQRALKPTP